LLGLAPLEETVKTAGFEPDTEHTVDDFGPDPLDGVLVALDHDRRIFSDRHVGRPGAFD